MRGHELLVAVLVGGALLLFGVVEWAALPLLTDPLPAMRGAGLAAALVGVGLLTADVRPGWALTSDGDPSASGSKAALTPSAGG